GTAAPERLLPEVYDDVMATPGLAAALRRIARAVSGTLELGDVFAEVAQATSQVIPFEWMGVARAEGDGETLAYRSYSAATGARPEATDVLRLADFSPTLRPSRRGATRFGDVTRVLDPSFAIDRKFLESGKRSSLYVTLWRGERLFGFVSLTSGLQNAFT